jgi:hypothetical protein
LYNLNQKIIFHMKKIYMSLFAVSLVSGVVAQNVNSHILPAKKNTEISTKSTKTVIANQLKATSVWSNTMNSAADWTFTNTSSPALDWNIEMDPAAIPVAALAPASFTSVANGYAFINSDAAGGTATQDASMTLVNAIDLASLSTSANFSLTFEHSYRTYQDTRTVRVSGDGGASWTNFVITDGSEAGDNVSGLKSLNISSVVAPGGVISNNVLIEFNYIGAWGWYWAVDDLNIVETDDNDLTIDGANFGTLGTYGVSLPYYQIPAAQVQPIEFYAIATNIGALDQTNAMVTVDVTGAGTFTGTSAGLTSVVAATDTMIATTMYTPSAAGTYNVNYTISMDNADANTTDNSMALAFDVTSDIYARDNGVVTGGSFNSGEAYELGNVYDIFVADDLYAVDIKLSTSTEGNPLIFGKLYSLDPTDGSFIFVDQTDDYAVTAAEITAGAEISLAFNSPITLNAGQDYLIVVGSYGDAGATNDLVVAAAGESGVQTTFLYDEPTTTWFYTTSTPWVRMNFAAPDAVEEIVEGNVTVSQNFPNPFTGNTTVNYTLSSNDEVMVEITDVTGKVIEVMNEGVRTAGSHTVTINSNKLAAGTYYYSVSTSNGKVTKAMNVTK